MRIMQWLRDERTRAVAAGAAPGPMSAHAEKHLALMLADPREYSPAPIYTEMAREIVRARNEAARLHGEQRIACGASSNDPETEKRFAAMRADEGFPIDDAAACGRRGIWAVMFRCVECGRWFHRDCIRNHFAIHSTEVAR